VTHILGVRAFGTRLLCEQVNRRLTSPGRPDGGDEHPSNNPLTGAARRNVNVSR
jgi:hypothetical protein